MRYLFLDDWEPILSFKPWITAICTKRLLITLHGQSLNRGLPWPLYCHMDLDPVSYARLNPLSLLSQYCSFPLRCFWFVFVCCWFVGTLLLKSLKERWWGKKSIVFCFMMHSYWNQGRAYTPDKQTVKCFEADPDETGSYTLTTKSVITHRYKEKQCTRRYFRPSFYGKVNQLESFKMNISLGTYCRILLCCFL